MTAVGDLSVSRSESDDIIDLSSDEETVQQDNIATRPTATSLDRQIVFDIADDGRQGVQGLQDVFVETGEVRKEATKSGGNVKAAASSTVAKKGPLDTTATQTCSPTAVQLPSKFFSIPFSIKLCVYHEINLFLISSDTMIEISLLLMQALLRPLQRLQYLREMMEIC